MDKVAGFEAQLLTKDEFAERVSENPTAILPLGATEQHGPHLPLGVDTILASECARRLGAAINAVVLPALPYGQSWVWRDNPGTVTLDNDTLIRVIRCAAASAARHGVKDLVLVSGHEANAAAMKLASRDHWDDPQLKVWRLFYPGWQQIAAELCESKTWHGIFHADEIETSLMLAVAPELVDMAQAVREYPAWNPQYFHGGKPLGDISASGVFGDATAASAAKGEQLLTRLVEQMAKACKDAMGATGT